MVSKDDKFCIKNVEFCIKIEEFCIKIEEFCIKNDGFCSDAGAGCSEKLVSGFVVDGDPDRYEDYLGQRDLDGMPLGGIYPRGNPDPRPGIWTDEACAEYANCDINANVLLNFLLKMPR